MNDLCAQLMKKISPLVWCTHIIKTITKLQLDGTAAIHQHLPHEACWQLIQAAAFH